MSACKHLERSRHISRAPYAGLRAVSPSTPSLGGLETAKTEAGTKQDRDEAAQSASSGHHLHCSRQPPCYRELSLVCGTQTGGESGVWGRCWGAQISAEQKRNRRGPTRAPRPGITRMGCITGTPSPCSEESPSPPSEHQVQLGPPLPLPPEDAQGPRG